MQLLVLAEGIFKGESLPRNALYWPGAACIIPGIVAGEVKQVSVVIEVIRHETSTVTSYMPIRWKGHARAWAKYTYCRREGNEIEWGARSIAVKNWRLEVLKDMDLVHSVNDGYRSVLYFCEYCFPASWSHDINELDERASILQYRFSTLANEVTGRGLSFHQINDRFGFGV